MLHGDWDDVEAALEVALSSAELAVIGKAALHVVPAETNEISTRRVAFDLVTVGDEPAAVRFAALRTGDPTPIEVFARIGRFGDVQLEDRLLAAIAHRLTQLEGKDFAPLK